MADLFLKTAFLRFSQFLLQKRARVRNDPDLQKSAIVFAPHEDDETLGCGGTIIKKMRAGANVHLVFMTDGRNSHRHLMTANELIVKRRQEAIAAAGVLGIRPSDVHFFSFQDSKLESNRKDAIAKTCEILRSIRPDEVYIPCIYETPADHIATRNIVIDSLNEIGLKTDIFEYPVWFWNHWPWTTPAMDSRRDIFAIMKNSIVSEWRLHKNAKCSVDISNVLSIKQAALEEHKSQMTRLVPDAHWLTLADVSSGELLKCFFYKREYFFQHKAGTQV